MSSSITSVSTKIVDVRSDAETSTLASAGRTVQDSVKDSGRVHFGGSMMKYGVKDSGRVHFGGSMMKY